MRSSLLFAVIAPVLVAAAPPTPPKIYSISFSGNGCPDAGDVKTSATVLGDTVYLSYRDFSGDNTGNCAAHLQATGGSEGWQVALQEVEYKGDVTLKPGSSLDTYTTVFWSQNAADTSTLSGQLVSADTDIKEQFTIVAKAASVGGWSQCTGSAGYTGILNVNARPVIQGEAGTYSVKGAKWSLVWREC